MPTNLSAKLSADAANQLQFGSDSGILAPAFITPNAAGNHWWTIDNQFASAGSQYYYLLASQGVNGSTMTLNTAQVWPIMFTRSCRVTDAQVYNSTAGSGSFVYVSMYAAHSTTRLPAGKITDLMRFNTQGNAVISRATMFDSTTVFAANTLYWVCDWATGSSGPVIHQRPVSSGAVRLTSAPTAAALWATGAGIALLDTSQSWASVTTAPATLSPAGIPTNAAGTLNNYPPHIMWGLTNA